MEIPDLPDCPRYQREESDQRECSLLMLRNETSAHYVRVHALLMECAEEKLLALHVLS